MNLRSVDLNLLVIFEALVEERSVTKAAARIGVTQSAVSHALRRLRVAFDDVLLVRTASGMEPTPQAVKLAAAFKGALAQIEGVLDTRREFDPARVRRTFHLSVSDYVAGLLLPRLCRHMRLHAPDAGLSVAMLDGQRGDETVAYEGVEVRLSPTRGAAPAPRTVQRLFQDRVIVVMRADHPAAAQRLDLEAYLALAHLKITGVGASLIDDMLATSGRMRRVMVKVPGYYRMLEVVASTDLVASVPAHWLATAQIPDTCVARPLPLAALSLSFDAVWHPRNDEDPGHRWFRESIAQVFRELPRSRARVRRGVAG